MNTVKSQPRLSQRLSTRQQRKLKEHIPDGVRTKFFSIIIDDLIEVFEGPYGEYVLGAVLSQSLKPRQIIKSLPSHNGESDLTDETS